MGRKQPQGWLLVNLPGAEPGALQGENSYQSSGPWHAAAVLYVRSSAEQTDALWPLEQTSIFRLQLPSFFGSLGKNGAMPLHSMVGSLTTGIGPRVTPSHSGQPIEQPFLRRASEQQRQKSSDAAGAGAGAGAVTL
jgi:hypothetical protein